VAWAELVADSMNRLRGKRPSGARAFLDRLLPGAVPAPAAPQAPVREITNSIGMKLALIPAGTFLMGSPSGEEGRGSDEGPQHKVTITRPFYMGVYQVTQEEYERVVGSNPSHFSASGGGKDKVKGKDTRRLPAENVSWDDAVEFCRRLSELPEDKRAGRLYRLPTEAEWEYSCRGGASDSKPFYFRQPTSSLCSTQANFNGNGPYGGAPKGKYLERTTVVGNYEPNAFGLYDMHGNVWEWCADWYDENYYQFSPQDDPEGPKDGDRRVLRGGSWRYVGRDCRAADRSGVDPGGRGDGGGFRVVLVAGVGTP
jgi:formylglycine-generating enzyme required for sulfatase activity